MNALASHHGKLRRPEPVPPGVVSRIRDFRVETDLTRRPAPGVTDRASKGEDVIVRIRVAEGMAVETITPPEAFRRVERGASTSKVYPHAEAQCNQRAAVELRAQPRQRTSGHLLDLGD